MGIQLPDTVRDPFKATTERLNRFISPEEEIKNPIIRKDVFELEEQVKKFELILSGKAMKEEFDRLVPYRFLGDTAYDSNDYESALTYFEKALIQKPDDFDTMERIVLSYQWTEKFEEALKMSEQMIRTAPMDYSGYYRKGRCFVYLGKLDDAITNYNEALKYIAKKSPEEGLVLTSGLNVRLLAGDWKKALSVVEKALLTDPEDYAAMINKCIALKKLDSAEEANLILQDVLTKAEDKYLRACAFAVLGDKENMLKELAAAIEEDSRNRVTAKFDPDFADYQEDPDFRKLAHEAKE